MGQITGLDRTQQSFWSLEDMIASESMVREIDRFVETRDLAALGFTRTRSAETGRPGYAAGPLGEAVHLRIRKRYPVFTQAWHV